MVVCRRAPKEVKPVFDESKKQQCWYCKHNVVSDLCADCLNKTELFEKTDGKQGEYKPAWEYGTVDERWVKGRD